ncbi:hypothetical protein MUK42_33925 [Musa troglodytarum]|uniref:Uncharacterized protein n=1 Tax=Musa troglodytarum TaxID=320322 RepID=A0A9E7L8B8_9LILI|nr:hypothetical protein MUK42_33925 [Musa troglodytarum]
MMGDVKSSSPMGNRERDRELLIPVATAADDPASRASSSSASPAHHHHHPHPTSHSGREFHVSSPFTSVVIGSNLASAMWMLMDLSLGLASCVILFPIAITFYITWWFIRFVDGFFSPIYAQLGINIFGLGFVTSILFIFLVGVFMSSWLGTSVLNLGEWFIKRMPFVRHIYNASKQISSAVSPDQNKQAFKEVVIIRHPRVGEYAFGFITSTVILQSYSGEDELFCVYVPTNHLYIGDIFLVNSNDVIRPNLSVREGIEIVVSGGMSMPQILSTLDPHTVPLNFPSVIHFSDEYATLISSTAACLLSPSIACALSAATLEEYAFLSLNITLLVDGLLVNIEYA